MQKLSNDWFMGAIDTSGTFGISVSLQDKDKPYLKWFFILKVRDEVLAKRIKDELGIGTIRKTGNRYSFIVEKVDEIESLTRKIDFSLLKSPSTFDIYTRWRVAYLKYRTLSAYERRLQENIVPILHLRDDVNRERRTPRYNDCEAICKFYGWES